MNDIVQELIEETMRELNAPPKPLQRSRVWTDPEGYKYLVSWSNSVLLRYFIRLFTSSLPKSEYRRKAQLDDAARSVVRNQEEGYKRSTTKEYSDFVGYSQGSLEEVKGDVRELTEDGFLPSKPGSSLMGIGINLGDFNKALRFKGKLEENKGNIKDNAVSLASALSPKGKLEENKGEIKEPLNKPLSPSNNPLPSFNNPLKESPFLYRPLTVLYPPLNNVLASDLSYEIFLELINKTDYNLRILVESLERKLNDERKGYQVEQARIKDKFKK